MERIFKHNYSPNLADCRMWDRMRSPHDFHPCLCRRLSARTRDHTTSRPRRPAPRHDGSTRRAPRPRDSDAAFWRLAPLCRLLRRRRHLADLSPERSGRTAPAGRPFRRRAVAVSNRRLRRSPRAKGAAATDRPIHRGEHCRCIRRADPGGEQPTGWTHQVRKLVRDPVHHLLDRRHDEHRQLARWR